MDPASSSLPFLFILAFWAGTRRKEGILPNVHPQPSPILPQSVGDVLLKAPRAGTPAHPLLEEAVWVGRRSHVTW